MTRPSLRALVDNWRGTDASAAEKCRMTLANNWTKLRTGSGCCGNHGQPGC
jgi:hypothetical protein